MTAQTKDNKIDAARNLTRNWEKIVAKSNISASVLRTHTPVIIYEQRVPESKSSYDLALAPKTGHSYGRGVWTASLMIYSDATNNFGISQTCHSNGKFWVRQTTA